MGDTGWLEEKEQRDEDDRRAGTGKNGGAGKAREEDHGNLVGIGGDISEGREGRDGMLGGWQVRHLELSISTSI